MNKNIKKTDTKMENIIKTYQRSIQGLIFSFTGKDNVQDIEQEVYVKVWKNLPEYKDEGKLWGWIKRITVNTCKDHFKSKQFNQDKKTDYNEESYLKVRDKQFSPEVAVLLNERQQVIINAIEQLKPKLKEVIILFDIKELTYEEISEKINCPIGTVKSRIFNARKQLQIELSELLN